MPSFLSTLGTAALIAASALTFSTLPAIAQDSGLRIGMTQSQAIDWLGGASCATASQLPGLPRQTILLVRSSCVGSRFSVGLCDGRIYSVRERIGTGFPELMRWISDEEVSRGTALFFPNQVKSNGIEVSTLRASWPAEDGSGVEFIEGTQLGSQEIHVYRGLLSADALDRVAFCRGASPR